MRSALLPVLLLTISLIGFTGYCYALIDWVQDVQTGVYERNYIEAIVETTALGLYSYLAIRFLRSKLTF